MGWWSTAVLGGDEPLDWMAGFEDELGVAELYPVEHLADDVVSKLRAALVDATDRFVATAGELEPVQGQVLAVLFLASGAPLPGLLADALVDCARNDIEDWGDNPERALEMQRLITAVQTYDGTPTVWSHPGLFEVICASSQPPAEGPFD